MRSNLMLNSNCPRPPSYQVWELGFKSGLDCLQGSKLFKTIFSRNTRLFRLTTHWPISHLCAFAYAISSARNVLPLFLTHLVNSYSSFKTQPKCHSVLKLPYSISLNESLPQLFNHSNLHIFLFLHYCCVVIIYLLVFHPQWVINE